MSSKVAESEFHGFENVTANLKVLSGLRATMKRKFNSEDGNVNDSPHHSLQTSSLRKRIEDASRRKDLRKIGVSSPKSKDKSPKLQSKPLNFNVINQRPKIAEDVIPPLKCNGLNRCSSAETETVISGGVKYSLTFIDGKHKITEKKKRTKPNQRKTVINYTESVSTQTIQTDVIKTETEILKRPDVSNCGVQTDAPMLKMVSDFSCQTMFPDPMSIMEFRRRITQLEQSLEQCRQEATKREKDLKKSEAKIKNLLQNFTKSERRIEMCQKKIDLCDKCSGRCDETTSSTMQTPFNQWTSTPMQLRAGTPSSSLHTVQNMLQTGMTTTPMISSMLPSGSTSRGEIVPYGFIQQANQPSTSFRAQNMSQNATTTSLVNSPQPTSTATNLISQGGNAPFNFIHPQQIRISPMCTPPQIMFSGVPQQLIVGHNVGQYNFQQALRPNQSLTSQQQFSQQQHSHSLTMASAQNHQLLHQNKNSACVQCFQQRHQQLPSLPQNRSQQTYNLNKQVQRQQLYNQHLRQQQSSQQQLIQHQQAHRQQLQALRQDLHQQQSHHQDLVQQPVVKQRKGTERQAIEPLEQAARQQDATKKVSVRKYLPKKD